jgi:hypothetical protein
MSYHDYKLFMMSIPYVLKKRGMGSHHIQKIPYSKPQKLPGKKHPIDSCAYAQSGAQLLAYMVRVPKSFSFFTGSFIQLVFRGFLTFLVFQDRLWGAYYQVSTFCQLWRFSNLPSFSLN